MFKFKWSEESWDLGIFGPRENFWHCHGEKDVWITPGVFLERFFQGIDLRPSKNFFYPYPFCCARCKCWCSSLARTVHGPDGTILRRDQIYAYRLARDSLRLLAKCSRLSRRGNITLSLIKYGFRCSWLRTDRTAFYACKDQIYAEGKQEKARWFFPKCPLVRPYTIKEGFDPIGGGVTSKRRLFLYRRTRRGHLAHILRIN